MSRERFDRLDELEDDLRRALAIEPSAEFLPRVRARIAGERRVAGAWLGWRIAIAGTALAAIATGFIWRGELSPVPAPDDVRHAARGRDIALAPKPVPEIRPVRAANVDRPAASAGRRIREEAEILVAPDAARTLARVLALARAGLFDAAALPSAKPGTDPLEVAPIVVPSIPIAEIRTDATSGAGEK